MIDATILIPTFRHAALVPYAVRSAIDQSEASVEVFIVGDGVEDASRAAIEPFLSDDRVRFFDFPKGPRHGELYRHEALREATGRIVCYLSDDDLLLRSHVADMGRLLETADFAHPVSARFEAEDTLQFFPWNYARPEFVELARGRRGSIGLTGAAHTLDAYRKLPFGWRTTPDGTSTDHYMWLQFLDLDGFQGAMGERLTYLCFPEPVWGQLAESERAARLGEWLRHSRLPEFEYELDRMVRQANRRAAEDYHLWARREQLAIERFRGSRTWRVRDRLIRIGVLRGLLARHRRHAERTTERIG